MDRTPKSNCSTPLGILHVQPSWAAKELDSRVSAYTPCNKYKQILQNFASKNLSREKNLQTNTKHKKKTQGTQGIWTKLQNPMKHFEFPTKLGCKGIGLKSVNLDSLHQVQMWFTTQHKTNQTILHMVRIASFWSMVGLDLVQTMFLMIYPSF